MTSATRVLIVEDSPTQAEALRDHLAGAGYEVASARTGEEGLERLAAERCDVVITDVVMPGDVDGYQLCRLIKSGERPDTPVVLLTSLSDPMDIILGLECGADNFLTKPYDPGLLLDRLAALLLTRQARARERSNRVSVGVKVLFMGREFTISSEREQILDLLITTFEEAVRQNRELRRKEEELREAEERLERYTRSLEARLDGIVRSLSDVLFSMSRDARQLFYVSPASAAVFGQEPEVFTLHDWRSRIHPEDREGLRLAVRRAVETGGLTRMEYRYRHDNGQWRSIEQTLTPVRGQLGQVERLDGVARDVTQQRQLELQLMQAQKMEAVGQLAGGIAHDFNNILTAILSFADLLLAQLGEHPCRPDLEEIRSAAGRAADLTRQLLAFSRRQVLEPRVLDLNAVVRDMDKLLRRLIGEDIELKAVLAPELGNVRADPGQIEQIIANLAVNARDAMPRGGRLTIESMNAVLDEYYAAERPGVRPGPYVMLTVSDTGVGMDREVQKRVFEPFFTTKERGKGTGLGLATVYGIVKQSGGNIWVYSEPGRGTTFKIYLPRVSDPVEAPSARRSPSALKGTETVLLVEDDSAVRKSMRRVLEAYGYTVLEAAQGSEALEVAALRGEEIGLLICDVVMPGMGGLEASRRLRALRPGLPVLFLSGYTREAVEDPGVVEPGAAFLQKPCTAEELTGKVRELLDRPS